MSRFRIRAVFCGKGLPLAQDGDANKPFEVVSAPQGGKRSWTGAHNCPHCAYIHFVLLEEEPLDSAEYAYDCPLSGKESTFGRSDLLFGKVRAMPPADAATGVAPTPDRSSATMSSGSRPAQVVITGRRVERR